MKQFLKYLAAILVIAMVMTSAISCMGNNEAETNETAETTETETEKSTVTKKPYIPPVLTPETTDTQETEKPEIPEATGPLAVETDGETGFFGAVDMH